MDYQLLANTFSPILHFHSQEQFFPCSIEYYLNNCKLTNSNGNVLALTNTLTPENLCDYKSDSKLILNIDENAWKGQHSNMSNVPIYARVTETAMFYVIKYIFLYAYNGPFKILGYSVGDHQCDIEHITMYVSKKYHEVREIFFSAHGHKDGLWIPREHIKFKGNRVKVYIAKNSHAVYPHAKTYYRVFGLANDHTDNEGYKWDPKNIQLIDDNTNWNCFTGFMGAPDNCPTPKYHAWWNDENGESTNDIKRIFCW